MSFISDAFQAFLQNISPSESQVDAAQRSHNALRTFLVNDDYFGGLTIETFLNGSYARRTAIQPIKDVDVIIVVDKEWMEGDPSLAMESLRRKLAQRYPGRRTRRQRRAVKVTLSDIRLDVLLATAPTGPQGPLRIPDRELRRWIITHPKAQLSLVKILGTKTNGNYSRLVRIAKAWAFHKVSVRDHPGSFTLECAVYQMLAERPAAYSGALNEAFATLIEELHRWDFGRSRSFLGLGGPMIVDPALPDVNVAKGWDGGRADRMREDLAVALRRIGRAFRSRGEESEVRRWGEVLGGVFPAPVTVMRRTRQ